MHKIKIGLKTWKFRTSFGEFDCTNIKDYMNIHQAMDDTREKYIAEYNSIKALESEMWNEDASEEIKSAIRRVLLNALSDEAKRIRGAISDAENNCSSLQMQLHLIRVDLLASLCYSSSFKEWALNTPGVDKSVIDACLRAIFKKLGSFTDFWDSVPPVESFSIGKRFGFKKKYKVHDMDCTSLYRESISLDTLNRAMTERSKLDDGYFDDLSKFVATITRPSNQKEEISFNSKAFIKGKKLKGLSSAEKLTYYTEKLNESIEERTDRFKSVSLSIAIGVIKCYFEKKKRLEKDTKESTKAKKQP